MAFCQHCSAMAGHYEWCPCHRASEEQAIIEAARAFEKAYAEFYEKRCRPDRAAMAVATSRLIKAVRESLKAQTL